MDAVRYWVAFLVVAGTPGMFLYWLSVHPFIEFWRRVGPRRTVAIHYAGMFALAIPGVLLRDRLLAVEFGTRPVLAALGGALLVAAALARVHINRQLSNRTLTGLPELAPDRYPSLLLTEGIYARVRHPRYAQIVVALLAYALVSNYLAVWVVVLVAVPWVHLVARLEERELLERFGEAYERYRRQVPRRFVPVLGRSGRGGRGASGAR